MTCLLHNTRSVNTLYVESKAMLSIDWVCISTLHTRILRILVNLEFGMAWRGSLFHFFWSTERVLCGFAFGGSYFSLVLGRSVAFGGVWLDWGLEGSVGDLASGDGGFGKGFSEAFGFGLFWELGIGNLKGKGETMIIEWS